MEGTVKWKIIGKKHGKLRKNWKEDGMIVKMLVETEEMDHNLQTALDSKKMLGTFKELLP